MIRIVTRRAKPHTSISLLVIQLFCIPATAQTVGTPKWTFDTNEGVTLFARFPSSQVFSEDGTIYIVTTEGNDTITF